MTFHAKDYRADLRDLERRIAYNRSRCELIKQILYQLRATALFATLLPKAERDYVLGLVKTALDAASLTELKEKGRRVIDEMATKRLLADERLVPAVIEPRAYLRKPERRSLATFYKDFTGNEGYAVFEYLFHEQTERELTKGLSLVPVADAGRTLFVGKGNAGRAPLLNHAALWVGFGLMTLVRGKGDDEAPDGEAAEPEAEAAEAEAEGGPRNKVALSLQFTVAGLDWYLETQHLVELLQAEFVSVIAAHEAKRSRIREEMAQAVRPPRSMFTLSLAAAAVAVALVGTAGDAAESTLDGSSTYYWAMSTEVVSIVADVGGLRVPVGVAPVAAFGQLVTFGPDEAAPFAMGAALLTAGDAALVLSAAPSVGAMTNAPVVAGWTAAVQRADRWAGVFAVDDAGGPVEGVAGGWMNVGEHVAPRSEGIEAVWQLAGVASPLERLGGTDPLIPVALRSAELSSPLDQLGGTRPLVLATATAAADWTPVPAVLSDGAPAL